jgi:hypothetical protein
MIKNILIICSCLLCQACGLPDLITPREVLRTNLRLDGYYVYNYDGISRVKFLYKNGVIFNFGQISAMSDVEMQKLIRESVAKYGNKYRKNSTNWEVFNVSGTLITMEHWNSSLGSRSERTIIEKGTITNDKSFGITAKYDRKGKKIDSSTETYIFKQFSPKPDSTNNFIK